ncbi:MAG: hypothetical protein EOP84_30855, partial [Verrucomicrobiaceae bacterium]
MATSTTPYLAPSLKNQGYTGATGTTPYRPVAAEQVRALQEQYRNSFASGGPLIAPSNTVVVSVNFDGTHNNGAFPAPGESPTNVYRLVQLQQDAGNSRNTFYYPGVGAQTLPTGTLDANGRPAPGTSPSTWDALPSNAGDIANGIVEEAYRDITRRVAV